MTSPSLVAAHQAVGGRVLDRVEARASHRARAPRAARISAVRSRSVSDVAVEDEEALAEHAARRRRTGSRPRCRSGSGSST